MTGASSLRVDKWLWYARFFKTRSLATKFTTAGKVRLTRTGLTERLSKPSASVMAEDILTFPLGEHVRVIRVLELGTRRGPAVEARNLYEDLEPPVSLKRAPSVRVGNPAVREAGAGRPTKKQRRDMDRLKPEFD